MIIENAAIYLPPVGRYDENMDYTPPVPELNLLVSEVRLYQPDHIVKSAGGTSWTVFEYGETLINFADAHQREEHWKLGDFNVSGATEWAYFPVTVGSLQDSGTRELYVPVPYVKTLLAQHSALEVMGQRWGIQVNEDAAERGQVEFDLFKRELPPTFHEKTRVRHMPDLPFPQVIDADVV